MEPLIFPCIIAGPGSDGLFGVAVPGANVNGQGPTEADALADAAACLQELIDEAENLGEAPIRPGAPAEIDTMRDDGDRLGAIITRPATVAA